MAAINREAKGDALPLGEEIARIEAMIRAPHTRNLSNRPQGPALRPRNASTLVLVDGEPGAERVLMGRRNRALKFMPGALVFPGGAVDANNSRLIVADELAQPTKDRIEAHYRGRFGQMSARALAVAAVRELAEETGILVGRQVAQPQAGSRLKCFADHNVTPMIGGLALLARAITPPGPPRRFDTWFFVARASSIAHVPPGGFLPSGELEELRWIRPRDAMGSDTREITRVMLVELMQRLKSDPGLDPAHPVPFYSSRHRHFHRRVI